MGTLSFPSYLALNASGELKDRVDAALHILENCTLCPWNCGVNRLENKKGQCKIGRLARIYSYSPHFGEEKPISGTHGSGTIFFSGCNMHCEYCQNSIISQELCGMEVSDERLATMMLELQSCGCHNLNLVSPTHVIPQILQALSIAADNSFNLPLVYNTGGYDAVISIELLDKIIDIFLPDMKYADAQIARKFSGIADYPAYNRKAVQSMHQQVGDLSIDADGVAVSGLLIRHLVLPERLAGTGQTMEFIANHISTNTYINLMDQYRPEYQAHKFNEINRRTSKQEFVNAVKQTLDAGLKRIDHLIYE